MRVKPTDRFVKWATTAGRESPTFMDDDVIGFGVQVRDTGRKSVTLDYMFEGRQRRLYIGDFPDWSTNTAREHAKGIKREVDQGLDPLALRDGRRTAPTVKDLICPSSDNLRPVWYDANFSSDLFIAIGMPLRS
jgi:hypothetical protein